METLGLKNVNMLSKANYDTVAEPATDELWAVETETYSDDEGNWYRVYPDGWCEQGGINRTSIGSASIVTLLKPFRNTTYTVSLTNESINRVDAAANKFQINIYAKTAQSFTTQVDSSFTGQMWVARGYIA